MDILQVEQELAYCIIASIFFLSGVITSLAFKGVI